MSREELLSLQSQNDSKGLEMLTESGRFAALAQRDSNGLKPRAISSFNLFQTPDEVAEKMVSMIPEHLFKYPTILEPSVGLGRLFYAVNKKTYGYCRYTFVENNPECMKEVYKFSRNESAQLKQADFLTLNLDREFDIILMNPPFKMGTDIKHILHAKKFLKKGGILVSLCYNGVKQNKVLKPLCNTWEVLPPNSFKTEGTRASISLLTINK